MAWTTIALRIAIALAAVVAIWRGVLVASGTTYRTDTHLLQGVVVSAAVITLVVLLLRIDRLPWRSIGHEGAATNLRAFGLGACLWLLPAVLGTLMCVGMGWTTIRVQGAPATVLLAIPALMLGVFLLEALPEEFAFRGYMQGLPARRAPPWVALLLQAALFTVFAWAVGALDSPRQWAFIPCLGLILGYARALTGNVWTGIGVHTAWMTTAQLLQAHVVVEGAQSLQFVAFALLPSATIGAALGILRPDFAWRGVARA